jgi:type II secretory pathway pseudopilin PulG
MSAVGKQSRPYWLYGLLLALLLFIGITRLLPSSKEAMIRHGQASAMLEAFAAAMRLYADEHEGKFPPDLDALFVARADGSSYFGSRTATRTDPWNRPFLYDPPSVARPLPRVSSLGADGRAGGTGEDADLEREPAALAR